MILGDRKKASTSARLVLEPDRSEMEKNCSRIGARVVPKNLSDSLVLLGDWVYRSLHVGFYSKQNPVFHIHNYELSFELSYISSRPKILYKYPHPT